MQFRLKTLLIVVSCAALGAAAAAPWFRSLDELTQWRLAFVFGALGIINFASVGILAVFELSERARAGECWKIVFNDKKWIWAPLACWGALALMHGSLLVREVTYETSQGRGMDRILYDGFPGLLLLSYLGPILAMNLRTARIRFHERGLIYGAFIPRTRITSWQWTRDRLALTLEKYTRHEIPVRKTDQDEIEAILHRWSAANSLSPEPIPGSSRMMMLCIPCVFLIPTLLIVWRMMAPAPPPPGPALKARAPAVVAPAAPRNAP